MEPRWGGHERCLFLYVSSMYVVTAGTTLLTSETRCIVSGPTQASSVPRTERPIWLSRSTGASLFFWPGSPKSPWGWDDAEWRRTRATRTIRKTLNRCLPHGELLPEPAMAGSAGRGAQGEQGARTGIETHCPRPASSTLLHPTLLAKKGKTGTSNLSWVQPSVLRVPLSHSLSLALINQRV